MSSITRLAFILGAAAAALAAPAIAELPSVADGAQESRIVPGKWIVSLKPDMAAEEREDHFGWVDMVHRRSLSCRQSVGVEKTFDIGNFHGYVGEFDEDLIAEIGAKAEVRRECLIVYLPVASFLSFSRNVDQYDVLGRGSRARPRSRPHCACRENRPAVGLGEYLVQNSAGEYGSGPPDLYLR